MIKVQNKNESLLFTKSEVKDNQYNENVMKVFDNKLSWTDLLFLARDLLQCLESATANNFPSGCLLDNLKSMKLTKTLNRRNG